MLLLQPLGVGQAEATNRNSALQGPDCEAALALSFQAHQRGAGSETEELELSLSLGVSICCVTTAAQGLSFLICCECGK